MQQVAARLNESLRVSPCLPHLAPPMILMTLVLLKAVPPPMMQWAVVLVARRELEQCVHYGKDLIVKLSNSFIYVYVAHPSIIRA
jgi:hypothetical protein